MHCDLLQDDEEAYKWFKKAANLKDAIALAVAGWYLANGVGAEKNIGQGMALTVSAAERGSDYACYSLGVWYLEGRHGLPEDKEEAIYWLKRATDGSCSLGHLMKEFLDDAKAILEALEANK